MFRIGEFSRIARVSARLLRYYDELGLLKPGVVDASTGYRYYTSSQLQRLNRILVLRDLGLTLQQIGGAIEESASADQLRAMLELRRADAERVLAEEAVRLRHIEARIAQLEAGSAGDLDDVLIRAEPARTIVAVRDTVGSFVEARMIIGELARILPKRVPRETLGAIIGIAHSAEFEPDAIDVELGYVLNGELPGDLPAIGQRQLQVRDLPAVPHMAACVRVGLPEDAHLITGKIGHYVESHGYRLAGPGREVFLRPPRPDRMDESVVEMQFPVAREQGIP
ncbi:MAG TPA: MerR family transcriptional regulator [Steroidobacteraceae bacterium]|nr:MerR family transcriptional regulator [Steroidobacteraceae bacterium]